VAFYEWAPTNLTCEEIPNQAADGVKLHTSNAEIHVVSLILQNRSNKDTEVVFTHRDGSTEYFTWDVSKRSRENLAAARYEHGLRLTCERSGVHVFVTWYIPPATGGN